ncbi:MAG: hypothetical protein ACI976_001770 [Aureispira sp.]|jgi:hypothetical protein
MESTEISEPTILIRINRAYKPTLSEKELYDFTRGRWKLNTERAKKAKYAMAVYKGIIKEVYHIAEWCDAGTSLSSRKHNDNTTLNSKESLIKRYEFNGELASKAIREKYNNKSVKHFFVKGNSNPINYINV